MSAKLSSLGRLAWKEILGSRSFSFFFVLNLSLGLCGFLALESLRYSVDEHFQAQARVILGADLEVEVDDRELSREDLEDIHAVLPQGTLTRREKHFFTMAASDSRSRLVDIQAIDAGYPFYPSITLKRRGRLQPGDDTGIISSPAVWIYPELAIQLGIEVGDSIMLGGKSFRVDDLVISDPALSSAGLATAPKIYVGIPQIAEMGFFSRGSRYEDARYYKFPQGSPPAEKIGEQLEKTARSADLDVDDPTESSGRIGRFWNLLGDYLTLIAMVALFLAGVGTAYLFRGFLEKRLGEIAVLLSLGASVWAVRAIYSFQLVLLALCSTVGAIAIAYGILPILPWMFGGLLPPDMALGLPIKSIGLTTCVALLTSLFVSLPLLARLGTVKPAALFQESGGFGRLSFSFKEVLAFLPALLFYWGLAIWQSESLKTGSVFLGVFVVSLAGLFLVGTAIWTVLSRAERVGYIPFRLAVLNLTRYKLATSTGFLAIGAGVLLASIIPQVRSVLHQELSPEMNSAYPSLFMFDIQPHQIEPLRDQIALEGHKLQFVSPMVRARLERINGETVNIVERQKKVADKAGEQAHNRRRDRNRWHSREYNLTYAADLKPSETLVAGRPFSETSADDLAQISLEEGFAADIDVGVGDTMTFNVSGLSIQGRIVNLRHIRWASFQPNFFVSFEPGILEAAPHTFVATVPPMPTEPKNLLQTQIVKEFPNISIVDVTRAVDRVMAVVATVTTAMILMALLTLAAGIAVLISIARFNAESKRPETALLKVLGARFQDVRKAAVYEFAILGGAAALGGSVLSVGASYALCYVMFEKLWSWSWQWPVAILIAAPLLCAAAGLMATQSSLRTRPQWLLAEST